MSVKGGVLVHTESLGYIQFGIPLGGIIELKELNIEPPTFYVLPTISFHKKQALNLAEFYAPALMNYLNGREFKILCFKQQRARIEQIVKLSHKPFNPFELYKVGGRVGDGCVRRSRFTMRWRTTRSRSSRRSLRTYCRCTAGRREGWRRASSSWSST